MRIELAVLALTAIVSCGAVEAADTAIENEALRVVVRADDNSISIERPPSGLAFVKKAVFPQDIEKAAARDVEHAVWGKGRAIELSHPGGWTTEIAIYPSCTSSTIWSFCRRAARCSRRSAMPTAATPTRCCASRACPPRASSSSGAAEAAAALMASPPAPSLRTLER